MSCLGGAPKLDPLVEPRPARLDRLYPRARLVVLPIDPGRAALDRALVACGRWLERQAVPTAPQTTWLVLPAGCPARPDDLERPAVWCAARGVTLTVAYRSGATIAEHPHPDAPLHRLEITARELAAAIDLARQEEHWDLSRPAGHAFAGALQLARATPPRRMTLALALLPRGSEQPPA